MKVGVIDMMQAFPQPQQKSVAMTTRTAGLLSMVQIWCNQINNQMLEFSKGTDQRQCRSFKFLLLRFCVKRSSSNYHVPLLSRDPTYDDKEIQMLPNLISKKTLKTLDGPLADRGRGKTKELTKAGWPLLSCKTPTGSGAKSVKIVK